MWTTGDNVDETFTGTGLTSVNSLTYSFNLINVLGGGNNELINILINGVVVDSITALDCNYCFSTQVFSNSVSFASIVGNGTYDLTMVLQNTIPDGGGSIAFTSQDGSFTLDAIDAVPEPSTIALLGAGLLALGLRRRKAKTQA